MHLVGKNYDCQSQNHLIKYEITLENSTNLCKMSRYYNVDDDAAAAEVYKVTEKKIEAAKRWPKSGKGWSQPEKARKRKRRTGDDPFPGKAPVDPEALERHDRGPGVDEEAVKQMKTKFARKEMKRR